MWSGASPQQSSLFSKNEEDEPGKRRAGRARQREQCVKAPGERAEVSSVRSIEAHVPW